MSRPNYFIISFLKEGIDLASFDSFENWFQRNSNFHDWRTYLDFYRNWLLKFRVAGGSFDSYLTGRVQSTQIGSNVSTKLPTACGVPQGSVLWPSLFLLYVNDLCRSSDKLSPHLLADHTNLLEILIPLKEFSKPN